MRALKYSIAGIGAGVTVTEINAACTVAGTQRAATGTVYIPDDSWVETSGSAYYNGYYALNVKQGASYDGRYCEVV